MAGRHVRGRYVIFARIPAKLVCASACVVRGDTPLAGVIVIVINGTIV